MAEPKTVVWRVAIADYDAATDLLWRHGSLAVGESAEADGRVVLTAGFATTAQAVAVVEEVAADAELIAEDPDAWVATWRTHAQPYRIGPFHIRLPEHIADADPRLIDIEIEPGATFGYAHESTRLALTLLATLDFERGEIADVGSGSGVLAIAAAALAKRSVDAVDIDERSVVATADNAKRNGVGVDVVHGSVAALPRAPYASILANVTAATACDLADNLLAALADDGRLVVSGLLSSQRPRVEAAFAPLQTLRAVNAAGWAALLLGSGTGPGKRGREPHKIQSS